MDINMKCWTRPIEFKEMHEDGTSEMYVAYGWPDWASRSVWLVPGTIEDF